MRLELQTGSPEPIYAQIVRQVRAAVALGRLKPDERLPSVRALARELLVNPNTVQKAYGALERDGLGLVRRGRGTFVAASPPQRASRGEAKARFESLVDSMLVEAVYARLGEDGLQARIRARAGRYRLAEGGGR